MNVGGLRNALAAAAGARARGSCTRRRSSPSGPTGPEPADESLVHPGAGFRNDYERTKAGPTCSRARRRPPGADVVILYPGVVYGPGDLTDGNIVVKMVADHLAGPLARHRRARATGSGRTRSWRTWPPAHVAALERGRAGERYFLAGENVTMNGLFATLAEVVGRAAAAPPHPVSRSASALGYALRTCGRS